ncbi:MAG: hypothetical protein IPI87_09910, partial [Betaproteobacteria bacterium]|nr:hypothetical protein [Betaproteobacteria bacterium]
MPIAATGAGMPPKVTSAMLIHDTPAPKSPRPNANPIDAARFGVEASRQTRNSAASDAMG